MEERGEARAGMTVRDLYEVIIRVISFGFIVVFLISLPYLILNVISYYSQDFGDGVQNYTAYATSILSQLSYLVAALVIFFLAPAIARLLERDPLRPAPVIKEWSLAFATEMIVLIAGLLYFIQAITEFVPWFVRPNPPDILQGQRNETMISSGVLGVIALALVLFRVPIARFLVHSFRFGGSPKEGDAEAPSAQ